MIYEILNPKIMKLLKHYYTTFITTLFLLFFGHGVWGQQTIGIYESYAILNINSAGNTEYDLNANTGNTDFNNANLGTFLPGTNTLVMAGGINKTYKCNGGDVFGGNIYYRVYLTSGSAPSFTSLSMGWLSNDPGGCGGNQTWRINNNTTNIISGLAPGAYTIEVYSDAPGNPSTAYASNNGANYKATFTVATAWNGSAWSNGAPTSTIDAIIDGDLTTSTDIACKDLTINANRILTISSANRLTGNGTLTNNGTLTLESGATLVQGTGNTVAGSGTFNVKQALTGAGGATPSGRFWYLGSPVSGATSTALNAAGDNRLWTYSEATQSYTEITTNGVSMLEMQGHVVRLGASETSVFTGGLLNTGDYPNASLTNTGTTAPKRGYHLLSNPYPSYLNWKMAYDTVIATNPNISSTIWYRTATSSGNNTMVFDTYNATSNLGVNNSIGGVAPSRYIPPMQSFWVYNPNDGNTGSITFKNSMRSHQANGGGLKDIEDFPAFARLNLVDGDFIDQVVVYTDPNAKNKVDNYDSKKFLLPNKPQVYATVGDEQLVINGLKSGMAKTIVPLTVELPNTQVYTFEMNESYVENGSVILEDTQEGVFQDMGIHTTYQFSSDAGVTANRFVLHFLLPTGNTSDSEDSQVGINDLTNAQIDVINNQQGSILVSISSDLQASGEIQILDAAGSLIQSKTISDHTTALAIKQGAGIYFVRVITPLKSEMKKIFIY